MGLKSGEAGGVKITDHPRRSMQHTRVVDGKCSRDRLVLHVIALAKRSTLRRPLGLRSHARSMPAPCPLHARPVLAVEPCGRAPVALGPQHTHCSFRPPAQYLWILAVLPILLSLCLHLHLLFALAFALVASPHASLAHSSLASNPSPNPSHRLSLTPLPLHALSLRSIRSPVAPPSYLLSRRSSFCAPVLVDDYALGFLRPGYRCPSHRLLLRLHFRCPCLPCPGSPA
ncbi:uncharacterized protein BJ171DRAFT_67656 [Polychytrium aggregatum]|uniref:uncharacterized protein n=1 Tax=Polychytrium aggregatum TaxID=110093 RepID=UPI0022FEAE62|nr:uncharacterized protein BJ171DRAFT_67656 [Polychytrium aggregatum]KAI9190704.1 hypothetical protein BJ171DRAFT_67656 [Polychytrium aggregatum]